MSLSREQVAAVHVALLGHPPKDEAAYEAAAALEDVGALARQVARSVEQRKRRAHGRVRPLGEEKVVFLHLPKCGGTTLHALLEQWFGAGALHPERLNGLYFATAAQLAAKRVFSGHFDFYATQLVPGRRLLISFMRDPVERLISLYNFHRAHRPDVVERDRLLLAGLAGKYDIDAYFRAAEVRAHPAINNSIVRYLSDQPQIPHLAPAAAAETSIEALCAQAVRNLDAFAFIGFMDDYDGSVGRLARRLGKPPVVRIERRQVLDDLMQTNPGMRLIERQRPNEETLAQMEDLVRWDRVVYAAARRKFLPAEETAP